jgi:hypothetical protein
MGEAGLVDIDVRPLVLEIGYGAIEPMIDAHVALMQQAGLSAGDVDAWRRELEYSNLAGTFFMGMTMFAATARKP